MDYKGKLGKLCDEDSGCEEVLKAFLDEFVKLSEASGCQSYSEVVDVIKKGMKKKFYVESGECCGDIRDLCKIYLSSYAPPYCYYGLNKGVGYGLWPDINKIRKDMQEGALKTIEEDKKAERLCVGVNDDGKISLYRVKSFGYEEAWK